SPLVLDLDGNGVNTVSSSNGVVFNLAATLDGAVPTGWVAAGDGLLARDLNADGQINDGRELFGTATQLADGSAANNGFAALSELDTNQDGKVTSADAAFGELVVWQDANQDGVANSGELTTLAQRGITELNLVARLSDAMDNGNWLGLQSSYTTADNTTHQLVDVWFTQSEAGAAVLSNALNEYFKPSDGVAGAAANVAGSLLPQVDDQKKNLLLASVAGAKLTG
ncbi:MAG: hypothetical protein ACMV0H_01095, partial [Aquaspirillum sp.]